MLKTTSEMPTRELAKNCSSSASLMRMMNVSNRLDRATLDAVGDFLTAAAVRLNVLADLEGEKKS